MTPEDADAVRRVEREAFAAGWSRGHADRVDRPLRSLRSVHARYSKDPQGCFVAEIDRQVVGLVFSRTWGEVGWIGSLAVVPPWQRKGIGRALMELSLEYLRADPRRVLGLETDPADGRTLTIYHRAGFHAVSLSVHLVKNLEGEVAHGAALPRWSAASDAQRSDWLRDLAAITGRLIPGLDYSKEIVACSQFGTGETLVLTDGSRAVGFSAVALESPSEGWGESTAYVNALALDPMIAEEILLYTLLGETEALAAENGKTSVQLVARADQALVLGCLPAWGYAIERIGVRMIRRDCYVPVPSERDVDCSRWAG